MTGSRRPRVFPKFTTDGGMNRDLRVAVIGTGHLGRIHAKLLRQVAGAELLAVCDPNAAACQRVADDHDARACTDVTQCIDDIDAAVIAAPTDCHAAIATELIEAGKHVLVEKPLASSASDANRLAMLATHRGVVMQVGHVERFNPAFTSLGDYGNDVKYVEATRASRFPGRCLDVGVVMDLMIHDIDLVLAFTDAPVRSIHASGLSVVSSHEDIAEVRLEFECGLVANLKASRISPTPARDMVVYSPAGFAQIDFGKPALATVAVSDSISQRDFRLEASTDDPLSFADDLFSEHLQCDVQELEPRNAILDELHDFVVSIQSGSDPVVHGAAGARAVTVAECILEEIARRDWYGSSASEERGARAMVRQRITRRRAAA